MPSAADRVFGVAELAEDILLDLNYKQLFAVERVSRSLQSALQTSTKLRRIMFLESALSDNSGEKRMSLLNPILRDQTLRLPSCEVTFHFNCIGESNPHIGDHRGVFYISCERSGDQPQPEGEEPVTYDAQALPSWRKMSMVANSSNVIVKPGFGFKTGIKGTEWDDRVYGHHPTLGELADWLDTVPHYIKKPEVLALPSREETKPVQAPLDQGFLHHEVIVID